MTNEDLLKATAAARRAAHASPLAMFCTENQKGKPTGHYFLEDQTDAWARHSNEWMRLASEVDRRGLQQPQLNHGETL